MRLSQGTPPGTAHSQGIWAALWVQPLTAEAGRIPPSMDPAVMLVLSAAVGQRRAVAEVFWGSTEAVWGSYSSV